MLNMSDEKSLSTYNSLISISIEGYKFLALINGGALVAMLTFIGNMKVKCVLNGNHFIPFYFFSWGLFLCGLSMAVGYLTQLRIANSKNENITLALAILFFISSLLAFLIGCYLAINSLQLINCPST